MPTPLQCTHFASQSIAVPVCLKAGETLETAHRKYKVDKNSRKHQTHADDQGIWKSVSAVSYAEVNPDHYRDLKLCKAPPSRRTENKTVFTAVTSNSSTFVATPELTGLHHMRPERIPACEKSVLSQPDVLGRESHISSTQRDFGIQKAGVPTTSELNDGTSKNSHHLPNYDGHVPASKRNKTTNVKSRIKGNLIHEKEDIRSMTKVNICGYTGYQPHAAVNDSGPFRSGTDTTSGRANVEGLGRIVT